MGTNERSGRERARLAGLLARLADGDGAALAELDDAFGDRIEGALRRHLRDLGVPHPDPGDLHGLSLDGWLVLADCSGGWDPEGGALPWNWAAARLRTLASDFVGQHGDELDEAVLRHPSARAATTVTVSPEGDEPDLEEVFERLVARDETVALLDEVLVRTASSRDRALLLELRLQHALGDPSPANTVAALHRMTPAAVRQVNARWRRRLRRLVEADPRYAPVADLPFAA